MSFTNSPNLFPLPEGEGAAQWRMRGLRKDAPRSGTPLSCSPSSDLASGEPTFSLGEKENTLEIAA